MTSRRVRCLVLAAVTATLAVGGCGLGDSVAGIHPVPTESTGGAPLNEQTAQDIASGALSAASAAEAATGPEADAARKSTLTGSALAVVQAMAGSKQRPMDADPLSTPVTPQVLGIVRTSTWPRTIVTTTLDDATSTRSLQVLTSATPTARYVVAAAVPMLGGASVPSLGTVADGLQTVSDGTGIVVSPNDALAQLAAAVGYPKPATPKNLATSDAFTQGLRSGAAAQAKDLGVLGTYAQSHAVDQRLTSAYRLSDGGAIVFGQLTRTATVTPSKNTKQLTLPADVARILGHATSTKKVTMTYVEPVVFVIPTTGQATVVGAAEQLATAKES